jgi:hypothetical protein
MEEWGMEEMVRRMLRGEDKRSRDVMGWRLM